MNRRVLVLLSSSVTQRRCARILRVNLKTVVRKFVFLERLGKRHRLERLESISRGEQQLMALHFDEMESFERSKCLPLSIPIAVEPGTRKILSFRVGSMPAKGPLAAVSLKKYGPREDHRPRLAMEVFSELKPVLDERATITTDQNPKYPGWIKPHFPKGKHVRVKGRRGCVVGQGELKRIGFDPLFDLNHTCAMIRANISRLVRRTWCTTKRPDRLAAHLEIYAYYHNHFLT
jgi:hypothetical protein